MKEAPRFTPGLIRRVAIGAAVTTAAIACSSDTQAGQDFQVSITHTFSDGKRLTIYKSDDHTFAPILAHCDSVNGALIRQTAEVGGSYAASGNAIAVSEGHPACADGKLVASEFPQPKP